MPLSGNKWNGRKIIMKNYDLIDYVQNVHIETQQEVEKLLKRVVEEHDFKALSFDNTSKVITKLWDALKTIRQELDKEE